MLSSLRRKNGSLHRVLDERIMLREREFHNFLIYRIIRDNVYFARSQSVPLMIVPVTPSQDGPALPFVFEIALGVRRGEEAFRAELEDILQGRRPEINRILDAYGVPRVEISEPRSAAQ